MKGLTQIQAESVKIWVIHTRAWVYHAKRKLQMEELVSVKDRFGRTALDLSKTVRQLNGNEVSEFLSRY